MTRSFTAHLLLLSLLAPAMVQAQGPWTVALTHTMNPLPAGFCAALQVTLFDPVTKEVPRNPLGYRVSMADFDIAVTSTSGNAAVAQQLDASHWSACACQGGAGSVATVTATYPSQSLPAAARVPGVAFQRSTSFTVSPPKGAVNPAGCAATTIAIGPGSASGSVPSGVGAPAAAGSPTRQGGGGTTATVGTVPGSSGGRAPVAGNSPPVAAITPVNPTGFVAVQTAPGTVQLSWQPVSGVAFYGLFGPGVASGGQQVMAGTTTFTATNVSPGVQQWSVGSYYPGQITTGVGTFPIFALSVTAPVVATTPPGPLPAGARSGNYLVTVLGLRPYQASVDDFLSRDGMGDEVYAAAFVRRYDRRTGQLVDFVSKQTAAYGDVNKFTQRVQAGSASGTGGIRDGDPIPSGSIAAVRAIPAQDILFPWRLFEGQLTDSADVLIITPSIWEQDGGTAFYDQWVQQQAALNLSLFTNATIQDQVTSKRFGAVISGNSGNGSGTTLGFQIRTAVDMTLIQFGFPIVTLLQTSSDRPIGLLANGVDATMLPVQAVVLTREIIEAALAQPALGLIPSPVPNSQWTLATIPVPAPKPGIIVLHFQDDRMPLQGIMLTTERPAMYQMLIQVERMP